VVGAAALGGQGVVHRLDAVAVGVEEEAAVVVVPVPRPRAGCAAVAGAGVAARPPEGVDRVARGRREAGVQAPRDRVLRVGRRQREVVPLGEASPEYVCAMPTARRTAA
jgi:hypothetical protein